MSKSAASNYSWRRDWMNRIESDSFVAEWRISIVWACSDWVSACACVRVSGSDFTAAGSCWRGGALAACCCCLCTQPAPLQRPRAAAHSTRRSPARRRLCTLARWCLHAVVTADCAAAFYDVRNPLSLLSSPWYVTTLMNCSYLISYLSPEE